LGNRGRRITLEARQGKVREILSQKQNENKKAVGHNLGDRPLALQLLGSGFKL
jgi:hypothetical protein